MIDILGWIMVYLMAAFCIISLILAIIFMIYLIYMIVKGEI